MGTYIFAGPGQNPLYVVQVIPTAINTVISPILQMQKLKFIIFPRLHGYQVAESEFQHRFVCPPPNT